MAHFNRRRMYYLSLFLFFFLQSISLSAQETSPFESDILDRYQLKQFIDTEIQKQMKEHHIPGLGFVLVRNGEIVISRGYGVSDIQSGKKVNPDSTIFRIGSITKVFTGIGILQLVDRGAITLYDEVNQFLPEDLKIKDRFEEPVRIWHLLSHTAGFDQILSGRVFDNPEERESLDEALKGRLIRIRPSGTITCYDTYGIMLAGYIIEKVTGQTYGDYVQKKIFTPLGMERSYVEVDHRYREYLAKGYRFEDGEWEEQAYEWYSSLPASSIDANPSDMARFMIAVLQNSNSLLSREMSEMLLKTTFTNFTGFPGYANTFWEQYIRGIRTVGHGGVMQGYHSDMVLLPEFNTGIYFVYNLEDESLILGESIVDKLMERWFPYYDEVPPDTSRIFPVDTDLIDGVYADNLYCHTCFEGEGAGRSIYQVTGKGIGKVEIWGSRFYAVSHNVFLSETGKTKAVFRMNDQGEVRHMFLSNSNYVYEKLGEPLIEEILGSGYPPDTVAPIIAMTYRGMNQWEKAAQAYERILNVRPHDGVANYYLGYCYRNSGRPGLAVEALQRTFEIGKWKSYSAVSIADIYLNDLGDKSKALTWIQKAIEEGAHPRNFTGNPIFQGLHDDQQFQKLLSQNR